MSKFVSYLLTLIFLALGVTLGVLNPTPVVLDLFLFKPTLPLSVILAIVFIIGLLFGGMLIAMQLMSLRWQLRKQQRVNARQADKIVQLNKQVSEQKKVLRSEDTHLNLIDK
ncbi:MULTISPECIES: LapA family protein [Thiomicrorhabdus]|uniref:LapA family protein n=1 Tax=Thiomicrorhabdus heinhorstiae TaxID=2748010 RepID=A0ABS0BV29_9GAMM|nr:MULTISPECIES: LapA family protein [Thiomicrorhabdus]MBF6056903.1 LapA family protein [Thiomicrorhabdus heinhorstiae]